MSKQVRVHITSDWIATLLLPLCLIGLTCFQIKEKKQLQEMGLIKENTDSFYSQQKQSLNLIERTPSLGFRNLVANGIFLSFLQYFSDFSEGESHGESLSPDFFSVILKLDPFYKDYYLFLSNSTTLHAGKPQESVNIMSRGLESITTYRPSDSFYIWRYKGVDELLFLGDSQSAQQSFETAAEWASQSDAPDSDLIARASRQTAQFLARDPDSRFAQISAWASIFTNATSDEVKERAIARIQELGGRVSEQQDGGIQIGYSQAEN